MVHPNRTVEQHLMAVDREIDDLHEEVEGASKVTRKQIIATVVLIVLNVINGALLTVGLLR